LAAGGSPMAYLPAPEAAAPAGPAGQMAQQAAQGAYWTAAGAPAMGGQPGMVYAPESFPPPYGPRTSPAVAAGMQAASGEPFNPSQLSPTDMLRTDPYAAKVMWAGFEHGGGDIESGKWRYAASLPRAYGPRVGSLQVP